MKYKSTNKSWVKLIEIPTKKILKKERDKKKVGKMNEVPKKLIGLPAALDHLSVPELGELFRGLRIIENISRTGLNNYYEALLVNGQDVSVAKFNALNFRYVITDLLAYARCTSGIVYNNKDYLKMLDEKVAACRAAKEKKLYIEEEVTDLIDGKMQTIKHTTMLTPEDVVDAYNTYYSSMNSLIEKTLFSMISLGYSVAGMVGSTIKGDESPKAIGKDLTLMGVTAGTAGVIRFFESAIINQSRDKIKETRNKRNKLVGGLYFSNEINAQELESKLEAIREICNEQTRIEAHREGQLVNTGLLSSLIVALATGLYVYSHTERTPDGKMFEAKSLAQSLLSLHFSKDIYSSIVHMFYEIPEIKDAYDQYIESAKTVHAIREQMQIEKSEKIVCPSKPVSGFKIDNLDIDFYPDSNRKTRLKGDFSAQEGDIVYLFGRSASGKTSFLNLLCSGNSNHRNIIALDDGTTVDSLGRQATFVRSNLTVSGNNSLLQEITGELKIADLTQEQRERVVSIVNLLQNDAPDSIEKVALQKCEEFSEGQKGIIATAKLLFGEGNDTSVIVVDEPSDKMETQLFIRQLELIRDYARKTNQILIFTSHRAREAKNIANRFYQIKDGEMINIPNDKIDEVIEEYEKECEIEF